MSLRRLALAAFTLSAGVSVRAGTVQKAGLTVPSNYTSQLDTLKSIFNVTYSAYQQYACPHDELQPDSKVGIDDIMGWGATIVDALDTMWIMGFTDLFEQGVNQVSETNFNVTTDDGNLASVFDATIRYIGGLLSAYELSDQKYPVLLEKAKNIADNMAYAWVDGNAIPYNGIFLSNYSIQDGFTNVAQAGTLLLEWGTLTKYTKNDTYQKLAEEATLKLASLPAPIPGIPGQLLYPNGSNIDDLVTWGSGTDSYLEYLPKWARLSNTNDTTYADTWLMAVDSSIEALLKRSTVDNWLYLADYANKTIQHVSSHLACFHGGNWILGGKLLNNDTIVNYGLELVDACFNTYRSTTTGIGPESFAYISSDGNYTGSSDPITSNQTDFYNENGFYITNAAYYQRPEVLESNFYAWRATGDTKYLDNAVWAIEAFQKYLPASSLGGVGWACITDVMSTDSPQWNDQAAYFFAEVMKYLYLTFDDPNNISLDEYVFNTECHPFKAPPAKSQYGSGKVINMTN
ncbi:glycoside hydrolase family 47 protein [Coniophora puteana RWD-64-598 SS2]|uniref:alpha-1,2-Mannosidase n=1 Tax=Coniophora puteana (strain RWD-64-598) TaxID=741705 RepID=R7SEE4_CONPW|nr:glycoside hydrolase family 47 protein [Coniophora puteana RWD-64-598 SS2]EIW74556.1 glycoside hydrolase family 47 protein [Coniophora puteana RWD-64-598 SS2]